MELSLPWALQSSFKGRVSAFPPVLLGRVRFLSIRDGSQIALRSGGCWRTTRTSRNDVGWGVMKPRGWPRIDVEVRCPRCAQLGGVRSGAVSILW